MNTLVRRTLVAGAFLSVVSLAPRAQAQVVISQVYGGGGSTATNPVPSYKYDFVELYNNGATAVNLAGYSLQYFSATGLGAPAGTNVLQGTIDPGGYYLVREGTPGGTITGSDLTPYNDIGALNLAAAAGKIGLASTSTAITFTTVGTANVPTGDVDFVGYGTTANAYEGAGAAPPTSTTTSVTRKFVGGLYTDTDNNSLDFSAAATPIPHAGAYVYVAPAAAPEPSGVAALLIGAGVLGLMVARRRTQSAGQCATS